MRICAIMESMDILNRWTGVVITSIASNSLRWANLSGANLSEADLREANLSGADGSTALGEILRITGTRHAIWCMDETNVSVGCVRNTLAWWMEHHQAVGRKEGYSDAEAAEYKMHPDYCAQWLAFRDGVKALEVKE